GPRGEPPRKRGRAVKAAAAVLIILAAALAAAVSFRTEIVSLALHGALRYAGAPDAALTVASVGRSEIALTNVALGREDRLSASRIVVRYELPGVLAGRLQGVEIDDLRAVADAGAGGVSLGDLDPLVRRPREGGAAPSLPLPPITVRRAVAQIRAPTGALTARLDGTLTPELDGTLAARFDTEIESALGTAAGVVSATLGPQRASARFAIARGALSVPRAEIGGLTGTIAFSLQEGTASAEADIRLARLAADGKDLGGGALRLSYGSGRASLDASIGDPQGALAAHLTAEATDLTAAPKAKLAFEGRYDAAARALWPFDRVPAPDSGTVTVTMSGEGRLDLPAGEKSGEALSYLDAAAFEGMARLDAKDVGVPDALSGLDANVQAKVSVHSGQASATLPADAVFAVRRLSFPANLARILPQGAAGPLTLTVDQAGPSPFRLTARRTADGFAVEGSASARATGPRGAQASATLAGGFRLDQKGQVIGFDVQKAAVSAARLDLPMARIERVALDGHVSGTPSAAGGGANVTIASPKFDVGPFHGEKGSLSLPLRIEFRGRRLALLFSDKGRAEAKRFAFSDKIAAGPLSAVLGATDEPLIGVDFSTPGAPTFTHAVKANAEKVAGTLMLPGGTRLPVTFQTMEAVITGSAAATPYRGLARLSARSAELEGFGVTAERPQASLPFRAGGLAAPGTFGIAKIVSSRQPPLFAPLRLQGRLAPKDDAFAFSADALDSSGAVRVTLSGRHDSGSGRGAAELRLPPLTFDPGALQPAALVPALAPLTGVHGTVGADVRLAWGGPEPAGEGTVSISNLTFSSDAAAVEGLQGTIRFDRILPPATPPGQTITVKRIDAGVPIDDITIRFRVEPANGLEARLRIENAAVGFAGGRLLVRDAVFDPKSSAQAVTIEAAELDLERMLQALGVEGLSGTGRLDGKVPIEMGAQGIAVAAGRFAAKTPGVIHFRSDRAARVLEAGGESAQLMLRALEDFHYTELAVEIEKSPTGDARMTLHLLGRNPAVMEGHLFEFNINVTGNVEKLLSALLEAYRVSGRFVRRALELRH
ncbi:MAG: YdbH domain-containing protein, partial [Alphaproteobacteria bacterium]